MFGRTFYNGIVRKYVIVFGNMFNGIYVQRFNSSNVRTKTLKIPIAYGPKEKFLVRLAQDPNLDQDVAVSLPRMGFEMVGLNYAANRKLPSTIKHSHINRSDNNVLTTQHIPVPYDIQFTLSIFVKNADDGTQILEQILPYFNPQYNLTIKPLSSYPDIREDVPITLNGVDFADDYEGDVGSRRTIIYTLTFEMKLNFYGPITDANVITTAIPKIDLDNTGIADSDYLTITVTPTPAGVSADSDYGFSEVYSYEYE